MASFLKRMKLKGSVLKSGAFLMTFFQLTNISADTSTPSSVSYQTNTLSVMDHGTHGALFSIDEEDMIDVLKRRLLQLKESGKLEEFQHEFNAKARKAVLEPRPVAHITPTVHERVFYVDPTLIIEGDIVLPEGVAGAGHILAREGDRINPLKTLTLSKGLLFIDGDDVAQQQMAMRLKDRFEIVLVKGKPLALEEHLQISVFFDQGGILTKRFGIHHVPCKMEVDGKRLRFTEFKGEDEPS